MSSQRLSISIDGVPTIQDSPPPHVQHISDAVNADVSACVSQSYAMFTLSWRMLRYEQGYPSELTLPCSVLTQIVGG